MGRSYLCSNSNLNSKSLIHAFQRKRNPLIHNISKWSDTLWKNCSKWYKIFQVCLTISRHYALGLIIRLGFYFCMAAFLETVAQRCFVKIVFVNILLNAQENAFAGATFLIMLQARGLQLYVKKRICHRCFPEKLAKFCKTAIL